MNIKKVPLTNALNLSLFIVNVSQVLLYDIRRINLDSGILDLKAYYRAAKYFEEIIKMLPQKPDPVLFEQLRFLLFLSVKSVAKTLILILTFQVFDTFPLPLLQSAP